MKKIRILLFILLALALLTAGGFTHNPEEPSRREGLDQALNNEVEKEYPEGEIIVKFAPLTAQSIITNAHQQVGGEVQKKSPDRPYFQLVELPPEMKVEEGVKAYEDLPGVQYAEPNFIKRIMGEPALEERKPGESVPGEPAPGHPVPKEPGETDLEEPPLKKPPLDYFHKLWGLHNTGQEIEEIKGTPGADISALKAWEITTGSSDVVLSVIDTGVDYYHPDLQDNMWKDLEGSHGYDFHNNHEDPMDMHGHGTHVAGTAGAVGYNQKGITGVSQEVQIMALAGLGPQGVGYNFDLVEATYHAVDNGAHIINNSWGSTNYSHALKEALKYARDHDVLVVCSAGNMAHTGNPPGYPASFDLPNIISVAASDQKDKLTFFSNYSDRFQRVHLAAPGDNIFSASPHSYEVLEGDIIFQEEFDDLSRWEVLYGWELSPDHYTVGSSSVFTNQRGSDMGININFSPQGKKYRALTFDLRKELDPEEEEVLYLIDFTGQVLLGQWSGSTEGEFETKKAFLPPGERELVFYLSAPSFETRGEGVYLDNFQITEAAQVEPVPDTCGYFFNRGTSMAAPHVSGIAALLKAQNPDFGYQEIKEAILENVDPLPHLSPFTETGGRANAYKVLASTLPPPEEYLLEVGAKGEGQIKVEGTTVDLPYSYTYEEGSRVELEALPGESWEFDRWLVNQKEYFQDTITLTLEEETKAVAHFIKVLPPQDNIPLDKSWEIRFNRGFTPEEIESIDIKKNDKPIPVNREMKPEDKVIIIIPKEDYEPDTDYYLWITLANSNQYKKYFHTEKNQ